MEALIKTIVQPLVDHPDQVSVEVKEEPNKLIYHLKIHPDDVGKVIGKNGRIAKAIRVIVYAANVDSNKRIFLDIM